MPRPINRLSARSVASLVSQPRAGYHADGAGLYLLVTKEGTASWVFRYTLAGRKREMGLGAYPLYSLADARQRRDVQRKVMADGLDPIEARKLARSVKPRLWKEAREEFIAAREPEWKNDVQAAQWKQSLEDYGPADSLPVRHLDTDTVLACLRPIWKASNVGGKLETATRVRGRIERIIDAEKVAGHFNGDNPARWRGHLEHLLPQVPQLTT